MRRTALLGLMLAAGCSGSSAGNGNNSGSCVSNCSNGCAGQDDGCGKRCATTTCTGCCGDAGCLAGASTSACGLGGASCVDCGSSSNTCTPNGPQPCECVGGCWDATLASCETGKTDGDCGAVFPTITGTTCQACRSGKHCTLTDQGDGQIYVCQ